MCVRSLRRPVPTLLPVPAHSSDLLLRLPILVLLLRLLVLLSPLVLVPLLVLLRARCHQLVVGGLERGAELGRDEVAAPARRGDHELRDSARPVHLVGLLDLRLQLERSLELACGRRRARQAALGARGRGGAVEAGVVLQPAACLRHPILPHPPACQRRLAPMALDLPLWPCLLLCDARYRHCAAQSDRDSDSDRDRDRDRDKDRERDKDRDRHWSVPSPRPLPGSQ
eukprot:2667121-Rhodomonas_salina.1